MGDFLTVLDQSCIRMRNIYRLLDFLDRKVGQSGKNLSPIELFVKPTWKVRGIPSPEPFSLLRLGPGSPCFGHYTVRGNLTQLRLPQQILSIHVGDAFRTIS